MRTRSIKIIDEELDEWKNELRASVAKAEVAGRDLTPTENARLQIATIEVPKLQSERKAVQQKQREVISMSHNRNGLTLPVNGVLPENRADRPSVHYRLGKLKCFADARDAYDAGMVMRSIVAKEYHRPDEVADAYCQNRLNWNVTNTGIEGSGPAGGYLVPAPLSNAIVDIREQVGVMRNVLRLMPMTSDTLSVAKRAGGLTVRYPGETQTIDTSDKTWSQIGFVAKKRAVAHQISQELQDDALISVVDDAIFEMSYALADNEDREMITGDGGSTFGGVLGIKNAIGSAAVSTAATGHDTWGELDLADMTAAMSLLPDRFHAGMPVWLCSSSFYFNVMLRIHAAAGGNTIASLNGGQGTRNFLGYPVYTSQYFPTSTAVATVCAYFGTFNMGAILAERIGVRVARSDDYAFLNDMTTLKATTRYDFKIHEPGTAAAVGAYVALKTAS